MNNTIINYKILFSIFIATIIILWLPHATTAQITYTANDIVPPYNGQFRPGVNLGVFPPWTDEQLGDLSAGNPETGLKGIGAKSVRPSLNEYFLEEYGYDYRVGTFQHYDHLKLKDNTVIVGFPSEEHRDQSYYCPSAQSELFANMYEPIWDNGENGTPVNDENYYALYLYKVVTRYKDYTKFWEIWNEPGFDYTGALGWFPQGAEGNWWDNNPDPCDYKLRAPIFHYIRLLRISYEVIKFLDPDAYVVLSGTGFPSFLDAIMRNTDNPLDGSPTAEFPEGGGAYFDVMGFHSYPHFDGSIRVWSDEINGFEYSRHSDAAARGIFKSKQLFQDVLADYGYDGTTYPEKLWIITECNIPRKQFSDYIGSEMAQRNFIMKAYWECIINDILQLHVYSLGEDELIEDAISEFETMGMYQKLTIERPNFVITNEEGTAYKTTSDALFDKTYDVAKTLEMNLPDDVAGGAFRDENGNYTYMIWAKTDTDRSEDKSTTYTFPSEWNISRLEKLNWDYSETLEREMISANEIELTSTPIFLIEKQFTLSENTGCIPFEIDLLIENENPELSYQWTFEGGEPATSTATNPSVTFNETGTFKVTLNIQDAAGNTISTQIDHIIAQQLPEPNFDAYVAGPIANLSNQSSVNSESYLWDFGDGNVSISPNPEHIFFEGGNRSIELTATNACGSVTTSQDFDINIPTTSLIDYTANDVIPAYDGHFRPGVNFGVFLGWPDENLADISAGNLQKGISGAGAKSVRPAFYDKNLEVWGYDVLTRAYDHYENLNLKDNTVIVGFPANERQDPNYYCLTKQSEHFDRMYLDIWDNGENGTPINDENYYAVYLYETVSRLKGHVKFWEIWNEPSFDYSSFKGWLPRGQRGNWWENNPEACDYKLRAPIFHFVRLLRVSYEIIKYLDPDALVTLSGVGYPSFLDAVLRNTDNPKNGAATDTYPLGGGAYFDVMGFHSYPHFDGSTSYYDIDLGDWVYHRHSDAAAEGIPRVKNILGGVLEDYGYDGNTFPAKHWVVTEINIPRKQVAQSIGSEEAQRNFILKAYVQALREKILQFHVYAIGELGDYDNAFSEFDVMGIYEKLDNVPFGQEVLNDEGIAYKTISDLLYGTTYDVAQTTALNLPDNIDGGAFRDGDGNFMYVLWAKTSQDQSETAEATYSFPDNLEIPFVYKKDWDFSRTLQNQFSESNDIALTGAPIFLSPELDVVNAPTAAFYAPTPVACAPLTVDFKDLSAEATAWEWTFEGGEPATSTEKNPVVQYNTPGFYTVNLVAKNSAGEHTMTSIDYIHAQTEPEIDFTFTTDGAWGDFTLDTPFDGVTTFHWDFDDGFDFPAYNPSHYFFFNGDYEVQLISTNDCGSDTTTHIVSIGAAPTAEFTQLIETDCDGPATVEFKDLSPSSPTTWNWTFPEGSPMTATTIKDPIVAYDYPGIYEATLIVSNPFGSDTITQTVWIEGNVRTELSPTLCSGENLIVNGVVYDETQPSGVETFVGVTDMTCDSIVLVDITFADIPVTNLVETLCAEDFRIVNGTIYNMAHPTGTETLANASQFGCDSIVQIDLSFYGAVPVTALTAELCVGDFMVVNGTIYDEDNNSGTEVFANATANGCDSLVQVDLSFFEAPMMTAADVVPTNGDASGSIALTVEQGLPPYAFAWSNGATTAELTGLVAGVYAVTVTDGRGCGFVESFEVETLVATGAVAAEGLGVRVFPNPVGGNGLVFGELVGAVDFPVRVRVFDALGRVVLGKVVFEERFSLVLDGGSGVYFLEVEMDGEVVYLKVVKQ